MAENPNSRISFSQPIAPKKLCVKGKYPPLVLDKVSAGGVFYLQTL